MQRAERLSVPEGALVLLIGPAGSGKSTFAARRFRPSQVLSSDAFRALVADDPTDQRASGDAFRLLHGAVTARLKRGLLAVVDATNVASASRTTFLKVAARFERPSVAVVFDLPLATVLAWNGARPGRVVPEEVVHQQHAALRASLPRLALEGYGQVVVLRSPADVEATAGA